MVGVDCKGIEVGPEIREWMNQAFVSNPGHLRPRAEREQRGKKEQQRVAGSGGSLDGSGEEGGARWRGGLFAAAVRGRGRLAFRSLGEIMFRVGEALNCRAPILARRERSAVCVAA